ncbi:MAG: DNA primase [Parvularculaceae bacterium]
MPRFTPDFLDELKARLRPSDVIGRYVKLKKQGNEWAGLSPFTKEKTPSFFVNDQKGFFHDFSSGKHGDVIAFLQEAQKLSFHEAVARLAEEAGMDLPRESPAEAARAERAKSLVDACSAAAAFFRAMLRRADGREAAAYLEGREVTPEQIEAFGLGYAPAGRAALKDYLINKGFTEDMLVEAGLLIRPEDGGPTYDRFRRRIMFPIFNTRGQAIAFGGRALDRQARAKYLNSPETPLFHKGSVLYNYTPARRAAAEETRALIVCEGYMDVIALWGAGIKCAVAPLGTALTENQLVMLWRASDEPILCFDGDRAGAGAAYRAIDRALPLLKPGKSLAFAFLPEGRDPDDLIRAAGAAAFEQVVAEARPLADVLWSRELESRPLGTPERRAALRAQLRDLVKTIADKDVRAAYGADLAERLNKHFAPSGSKRAGGERRWRGPDASWREARRAGRAFAPPPRPSADLKRRGAPSDWVREAALVAAALNHPALVERQEAAFLDLQLDDSGLAGLLAEILAALAADPGLDRAALKSHLSKTGAAAAMERVLKDEQLRNQKYLRPEAEIDEAEWGFENALALHLFDSRFKQEVERSAAQMFTDGDAAWKAATAAREELINTNKSRKGDEADTDSPKLLDDALERMKASIGKKSRR